MQKVFLSNRKSLPWGIFNFIIWVKCPLASPRAIKARLSLNYRIEIIPTSRLVSLGYASCTKKAVIF